MSCWKAWRSVAVAVLLAPQPTASVMAAVAGVDPPPTITTPANAPTKGFPVNPGAAMPAVNGCHKQDYTVLIVVGLPVTH